MREFRRAWLGYEKAVGEENLYLNLINDEDMKALDTENRWSLQVTINKENISQHSYWTTLFTWILSKKQNYDDAKLGRAMTYSLFHDFDEVFSGDLNHKFKYDADNGLDKTQLKIYGERKIKEKFSEFNLNNEVYESIFKVDEEIIKLVKIADWLSALQFLSFEIRMGNGTKKIKEAFLYSLISTCSAIETFSTTKKESEVDDNLAKLYLELSKINNKIYKEDE